MNSANEKRGAAEANAAAVDPHGWLEEVEGREQLDWVRARNADTAAALETANFEELQAGILEVLDAQEKIPELHKRGEYVYNHWTDAEHVRGLWRRATLESFAAGEPEWEVLIDLDALSEAEGVNWVWHGANLLPRDQRRALVWLSRGGSDANTMREFDVETGTFLEDGFQLPESKGSAQWADLSGDRLLVARDFGAGSMTTSGYPRSVRLWQRGTPLNEATELFTAEQTDMGVWAHHDFTEGYEHTFLMRMVAFYEADFYLLDADNAPQRLDIPRHSEPNLHRQWLFVEPREAWEVGGQKHAAGSLLAIELRRFLGGARDFETLFTPSDTTSLIQTVATRNHLILNVLNDVKNELTVLTHGANGWQQSALDLSGLSGDGAGASEPLTVSVRPVDPEHDDALWVTVEGFLTPTTLALVEVNAGGVTSSRVLRTLPSYFAAADLEVEQRFVTSDDGTRVPYFQIGARDRTGPAPTLLYGYGGFEVPLVPVYSGAIGRAWLERGGVYVMANIRGGGEYGPRWHQAALKQHRHRAYEDFAAVARDLVERGVTTRAQLGVRGGSNGGLLIGNMLMSYPELFSAAVCQVPLLDMKRYSHLLAGASWMAEYGDPDVPEEWEFIRTFSPYHLHQEGVAYPPVLFTTSTRDDRVHPGHARKLAARMLAAGNDVTYYENIEGGHGGAATNQQKAYMQALAWEFLWQRLAD